MAATNLTTFLWFDTEALEAARFYVDLFPQSHLGEISYYQAEAQRPAGSVLTVEFELFGRPFAALNGGPQFPHSVFKSHVTHKTTSIASGQRLLTTVEPRACVAGAKTAGA